MLVTKPDSGSTLVIRREGTMPAVAPIEELREVDARVKEFQTGFPEAYAALTALLKQYRRVGYKNIAKLLMNEATPEKLKGEAGP
jgi:hypothetical protein